MITRNKRMQNEAGITLVALIITVIILVILAAVTIITLQHSEMIKYAVEGTQNYSREQIREEEEIKKLEDVIGSTLENLKTEGSGGGDNPPTPPEEPLPAGWDKDKVYPVISDDDVKVPVPIGFTPSDNPDEKKVETGFVIKQDGTNNEFVWVPTDNTFGTLYNFSSGTPTEIAPTDTGNREPDVLTSTTSGDASETTGRGIDQLKTVVGITGNTTEEVMNNWKSQLQKEYSDMKTSVTTYGGFYIGRYETGNLSQTKAVVAKGNEDINNQKWYTMYQKSKTIAQGTAVSSSMIWGCQWDATLKWFLSSTDNKVKTYVTNSTGMGNYSGTQEGGSKVIPAGSNDDYRVNNIYDMAGNVCDWTLEAGDTRCRAGRRRRLCEWRFWQSSFGSLQQLSVRQQWLPWHSFYFSIVALNAVCEILLKKRNYQELDKQEEKMLNA